MGFSTILGDKLGPNRLGGRGKIWREGIRARGEQSYWPPGLRDLGADPPPRFGLGPILTRGNGGPALELLFGPHTPPRGIGPLRRCWRFVSTPPFSLPPTASFRLPLVALFSSVPAARVMSGGRATFARVSGYWRPPELWKGGNAGLESVSPCNQDDAGLGGGAYCLISPSAGIGGAPVGPAAFPNFGSCPICGWISLSLSANPYGMGWVRGNIRLMLAPGGVSLFSLGLLPFWCCAGVLRATAFSRAWASPCRPVRCPGRG